MSWPQWSSGNQPAAPPVLNPATPVINSAPAVVPPGLQYTPEQYAQLQQQNWNQWAQWQQQYQQWHQQYGAEYQKSMNALAQAQAQQGQQPVPGLPNVAVPPPLPVEIKPPLPADDPPPPIPSYSAPPPTPQTYNTAPPVPKPSEQRPPVHYPKNNQNQNWQPQSYRQGLDTQQNKRPYDQGGEPELKRPMINKPGWQNQPQPSPKPVRDNIEELSEPEKKFDKQFADWEAQFNKWKEQNVEHPDKEQYKEYEKKWESWRAQLLERREQMRRKRLGLPADSPNRNRPGSGQNFNSPQQNFNQNFPQPPQQGFTQPPPQTFNQPKPGRNPPPKTGGLLPTPGTAIIFNKPPPTLNDEPLKFKDPKPVPELEENVDDFIKPNTGGGIPGLDLVKDDPKPQQKENDDVVVIDPEEKERKGPDFDAISKGINTILGDQKLLNMLSMVSQTQNPKSNDNVTTTVSRIKDASNLDVTSQPPPFPEQSSQSYEEHSNHSETYGQREFVNNFDDQTRSSFTMAPDQETRFEGPGAYGRNQNQFSDRFGNFNRGNRFEGDRFPPLGGPNQERFVPNEDRFGPNQGRFRPGFGPNQDKFGPNQDRIVPNQDKFGPKPDHLGPNRDKFGPNQDHSGSRDKFGPIQDHLGPRDKFGSNQDHLGPRDKFGPNQEVLGPRDKFGPNQDLLGPRDKFGPNQDLLGPRDKFGPNQELLGPRDKFGPNQELLVSRDKFGPNQDLLGSRDKFGPSQDHLGPNRDKFDPNQDHLGPNRDKFGGPNQDHLGPRDKFGPNQDHLGPNRDKFGPNSQDRFAGNQERFGPNQERFDPDKDRLGPNQERFGPNANRFGQNQERFGSTQDRFGPGADRFASSQEKFGSDPDRFDFDQERFEPNKDRFGRGQDRFGPNQDRFGSDQGRFGPNQDRFDRFGAKQDRFGPNQDKFRTNQDRFGNNQDRFGPQRNDDRFASRDDRNFDESDYNEEQYEEYENYDEYEYDQVAARFEEEKVDPPPRDNADESWSRDPNYQEQTFNEAADEPVPAPADAPSVPEEIFQPVTVIDYDHKPLKIVEPEVLVEPIFMFDYRHKPISRIPLPQRPKWLTDAVRNIREFDPPVVRPYEPPNLRRYPPPAADNWREDRYQDNWPPQNRRSYNENRPPFDERRSYNDNRSYDEPKPSKGNWNGSKRDERRSYNDDRNPYHEEKKQMPLRSMEFDEEKISDTEWPEDEDTEEAQKTTQIFPKFQKLELENKSAISKNAVIIEDLISPPGRYKRPPRIVIILRGPPGSGKTFLAKLIKDKEVENGGSAPRILSLDDYFMVEQEKEITEDGKKVKVKEMVYEYEAEMEESYRTSLIKSFKKTITDGYFSFIIVDNVNDKVKYFGEMWSFAKQNGFQVYICQLDLDAQTCSKRNIHGRSESDIEKCVANWEPTPSHHPVLDATSLLQSASIPEVEMEEVNSPESDANELDGSEDQVARSKWDNFDCSVHNLAKLDGVSKPLRHRTMEEYLRLDTEWTPIKPTKPGQKRVRWADLEEKKQQEKMRAIGFVVGHTNWDRMMDPTGGSSALTQTKYIERTGRYKVDHK